MNPSFYKFCLALACLFFLVAGQGCVEKNAPGPRQALTCTQAQGIGFLPRADLERLLAASRHGAGVHACWTPLVKRALSKGWELPVQDLALAVHRFNRFDSQGVFTKAVQGYFMEIARTPSAYGPGEKALMAAYLGWVIERADSKQDERLKQARQLCLKLDPQLYHRFFKVNS